MKNEKLQGIKGLAGRRIRVDTRLIKEFQMELPK